MSTKIVFPTEEELKRTLGPAHVLWTEINNCVTTISGPVDIEWKPSKSEFGRMCLLKDKKRSLVYLTPEKNSITVGIVLGEHSFKQAMSSSLPDKIKKLFSEAKPYAEGRGIRFSIDSAEEVPVIIHLLEFKTSRVR